MPSREPRPGRQEEPRPPFPGDKLDKPGLESELEPKPRFEAKDYKPADKLKGKKALITGGDSGIGRAVALIFAREGADVVINYLPEEQGDADETKRHVEAEGRRCVCIPGDLADAEFCKELVERAVDELGGLDILVSNAAYQNRKLLDEMSVEEVERTFRVNVFAYMYLAQAAVPHMPPGSSIIVTSSTTAWAPSKKHSDYAASKGAINQFTKVLAQQLIEKGIRVNAVSPGPVWTPLNPADEGASEEEVANFGKDRPIGRPAQPEEIAPAYVFLASNPDSSYITGIALPILGGEVIGG